jgi:8-amino-7-oxononanoate synthase
MATLGKALGGYGAFVGAEPEVIDWLVQKARTYVFSTALPPSAAASAIAAMDLLDAEPEVLTRLRSRIAEFRAAASALPLGASSTAIQPLVLGESERALAASACLLELGYCVPAIRPPTVPEGTARLRISLSAAHARSDVEALAGALAGCLA